MTKDQEQEVISSAVIFIKTITSIYGPEDGMALWERIAQVIDPDIKGKVFFSMITNQFGTLTLYPIPTCNLDSFATNKIPAIRAIRTYTGFDLREAKMLVDKLMQGQTQHIKIDPIDTVRAMTELKLVGFKL